MINGSDFSENLQRCHDYIKALEVERRKIQVFGRELPLSLELVTRAIETCKQQLSSGTITSEHNLHGQLSECSEHTSPNVPFFEEFIPMKKASSDSDDEENESTGVCDKDGQKINDKYCKKSDWLRSVQLWNQTPDPDPKDYIKEEKSMVCDVTATPPTPVNGAAPPPPTSPAAESGGGKKKVEKESRRKSRRCWSPELHRRFLQALQQLGGSHVATPKQIRELMKVDGLSNDEVKSHLQKYRLHTRRPSTSTNNNAQTPQFVVMGGIWVPSEYAAMAKTTTSTEATSFAATSNKIYAPIAAPPPPPPPPSPKQRQHIKPSSQSDERGSNSRGATQSCSPATSSSTHTTTISPAC